MPGLKMMIVLCLGSAASFYIIKFQLYSNLLVAQSMRSKSENDVMDCRGLCHVSASSMPEELVHT